MKSFDDELNDAIQKVLHDSFENFGKEPRASIDQKIYKALNKPARVRPLIWLSSAAMLLLLAGFGVMKMRGRYDALRSITHAGSAGRASIDTATTVGRTGGSVVKVGRPSHTENYSDINTAESVIGDSFEIDTYSKPANTFQENWELASDNARNNAEPVFANAISQSSAAERGDMLSASPIPAHALLALPVTLALPEIGDPASADNSTLTAAVPRPEPKRLDFPQYQPSDKKSFAWLFNVNATNTFQSIYLLPNAESRILKVSFPVSTANLGYKFSAGFQAMGLQTLFNYSHMSWKAEYIYAIDEFKADEHETDRYVIERLGKAETVTSKMDMAGIGIRKQLDFKGRRTGRFFAQFGLDYSRQIRTDGHDFLGGSMSAGKIIAVNKNTDLIVGPYFQYSFAKVPTAEYSIKVRPNQVGLSAGLRINRTKLSRP